MLFNSIDFAVFLPLVFLLYWYVCNKSINIQNTLIVLASYVFYGWWDWKFLLLILFSTIVDYLVGIELSKEDKKSKRKILLWISVAVNIGFLGFFKYFNFFIDNFITAFSFFGMSINASTLDIILPVGISFYTFQTLSYTIDVYKKKLEPTKDFISFAAFVSFFPQLVAGPIERASNLLPQFHKKRSFDYSKAVDGLRQILWGLFKKIVIANNCAVFANQIFYGSADLNGSTLLIGVLFFTFQLYGDFSGYSDIAIGTARLFGFNLMQNFNYPFFSRTPQEAWRRWHISLTTWFRDYVYIPLLFRTFSVNSFTKVMNVFILFVIIGFWHGANWTFILWGVLQALYFIPALFVRSKPMSPVAGYGKIFPSAKEFIQMVVVFSGLSLSMIFFRSQTIQQAFDIFSEIFSSSLFTIPIIFNIKLFLKTVCLIVFFILLEWQGREKQYAIEKFGLKWKKPYRYAMYYVFVFLILWFGGREQDFIYFQF